MPLIEHKDLYTSSGQRRTRALFRETCMASDTPVASIGKQPGALIPMRELFLEFVPNDPTEFEFAELVFGDYAHWKMIADAPWMSDVLAEWRMICDVKRKSEAFKAVLEEAKGGRSSFTAAKYLIEEPWKDKRNPKTKEAVNKSTQKARDGILEDVKRLSDYM